MRLAVQSAWRQARLVLQKPEPPPHAPEREQQPQRQAPQLHINVAIGFFPKIVVKRAPLVRVVTTVVTNVVAKAFTRHNRRNS